MRGISGADPLFGTDDGSAEPAVSRALAGYAADEGSERAALAALAASRLLVPVVAAGGETAAGGEKASEMALPTLIGLDGRRAIPAFTCMAAMQRWRRDARPVPAAALAVWQAAAQDSCAVVIDVGGPVPLAVEGARLAALARGDGPPELWADPDVREIVASVLAGHLEVAAFDLRPGEADRDLAIALSLAPGQPADDVTSLAAQLAEAVHGRLGGRLRRGVAIWLGAGR
ncbi:MAG: SseB family protein [Streptosporangiaceae bacterium]